MIRLEDIGLFVAVASTGSFTAAARAAGLLPAQASVAVKRLEAALGVDLFVRSTRHVRLTRKGEMYLPHARDILSAVQVGQDSVHAQCDGFEGDLAIGVSPGVGRAFLSPWLATFHRRHPRLRVRLYVGSVASGVVDGMLRYGQAATASVSCEVIAARSERILVASPAYLEASGRVDSLDDLARHACIVATTDSEENWQLATRHGRTSLRVSGAWCSDDGDLVRRWAVQGQGIAFRPRIEVDDDLSEGTLVRILPDAAGDPLPLTLAHRRDGGSAGVVRALAAWLRHAAEPVGCPPALAAAAIA